MKTLNIELVNYSEKALAIFGDTKIIKDELKSIGGRFNPFLTDGNVKKAGWIFPKTKTSQVESLVAKYKGIEISKEEVKPAIIEEAKELIFQNDFCYFVINFERKEINGSCKKDQWNQPRCYNTKVQKFKKAVEAIKQNFNSELTMYGVMNIVDQFNMGMRSYCAMD